MNYLRNIADSAIPIRFGTRTEYDWEGEGDDRKEIKTEVDNIINSTDPIWKKTRLNSMMRIIKVLQWFILIQSTTLFWIHLNIDYPFNLTGVLYFPKLTSGMD